MFSLFGVGGLVTMGFFAVVVSLQFGALPGVVTALLAAAINNFVMVAPAWEFSVPTRMEVLFSVFVVLLALAAPAVARHSPLRQLDPARSPDPCSPREYPDNVEPMRRRG